MTEPSKGDPGQRGETGPAGPQGRMLTVDRAILFVISLLLVLALSHMNDATNKIQEGRRFGSAVNCAALSAIAQAGKTVIAGSLAETPLTRFLERHGYPPVAVRKVQGTAAGAAYVRAISTRIEEQIGHKGDGLVLPDGTISCQRLAELASIPVLRPEPKPAAPKKKVAK